MNSISTLRLCTLLVAGVFFHSGECFSQACVSGGTVSGSRSYIQRNNITISGYRITSGGICLSLLDCNNVTITDCILGPSADVGIQLQNCNNVTITHCSFMSNLSGVYALDGSGIKVNNNQFTNVVGPFYRGQYVQFNHVTGAGNEIRDNVGEEVAKPGRNPEDLINLYKSSGIATSPILVSGNKFRGGGPDTTGGGIMTGDNGGDYQIVENNILVDPGNYGIATAGGTHISLLNNQIYGRQQPWTRIGMYVWDVTSNMGTPCSGNTVEGNAVNYTDKHGVLSPDWLDATTCGVIGDVNNNWSAAIGPEILPDRLLCPLLMAYYKFNANWNDASGSGLNAVSNNGAYAGQGENLMCANFDGTQRYLTLPSSPWLQAQSERFSVSCWIKPGTVQGIQGIAQAQNSDGYYSGWRMILNGSAYNARLVTDAGTAEINYGGITPGNWTHLVMVYDGKYLKGYVNGVLQDTKAITGNVLYNLPNSPAKIGYCNGTGYLNAFMDEFKYYDGSLSDSEILADYNANNLAVNYPQPEVRAYYSFNNNWLDNSGNGFTAATHSVGFVCDGANSLSGNFPGSGYLTLPSSPLLDPYSSNLTVACWIKPSNISGIKGIAQSQNGDGYNIGWRMLLLDGALNPRVVTNQGPVEVYCAGIQAGVWNYVVMTYDGLSLKGYVNGVLQGSASWGGYIPYNVSPLSQMQIGLCNGSNYYFSGHMDEFKFYDGALNATQVQQEYNTTYPLVTATPNCPQVQQPVAVSRVGNTLQEAPGVEGSGGYVVWPNPAKTEIRISAVGVMPAMSNGVWRVGLYNSLGQMVQSGSGAASELVLGVGRLSAGIYYLRIVSGENTVIRKVVIKK